MRESPDERVVNEDMGLLDLGEKRERRSQKAYRLAGVNEVQGNGSVRLEVLED